MTLSRAILATLSYSDYFSFPLTLSELNTRLISSKPHSRTEISQALSPLLDSKMLVFSKGYYHLPGRASLIKRRLLRQKRSLSLHRQALSFASRLGSIPGVLAIYLTGSLAVSNPGSFSDIDFLIIAKNNRLWTTRFFLTLYTEFYHLRRRPHSENLKANSGKLCLNLYLTPKSYLLPPSKQNLYSAYELIQAVPLFDPHHTQPQLLSTNSWINHYLPNFKLPPAPAPKPLQNYSFLRPLNIFEHLFYYLQLTYMRPKISHEYITPDCAFFHPHNPSVKILQKLENLK